MERHLPGIVLSLTVIVIVFAGVWRVFAKTGAPGWAALVPIYNLVVLLRISGKPAWWVFLFLLPVVNVILLFAACLGLARSFGKGTGFGLGLCLLGPIFFPILGFGSASFRGRHGSYEAARASEHFRAHQDWHPSASNEQEQTRSESPEAIFENQSWSPASSTREQQGSVWQSLAHEPGERQVETPARASGRSAVMAVAAAFLVVAAIVALLVSRSDLPGNWGKTDDDMPPIEVARKAILLDASEFEVHTLMIQGDRVVARRQERPGDPDSDFYEVYDLNTGRHLGRLAPNISPFQLDLGIQGTRLAIRSGSRIEIFSLPDGGRLTAMWQPYDGRPHTDMAWHVLLSGQRILTVTPSGQFDVWNYLARRKLSSVPPTAKNVSLWGALLPANLAVSADRRLLALDNNEGFSFFDIEAGKLLGKTENLVADQARGEIHGTAFSPDGKMLAAYFSVPRGETRQWYLARWAVPGGRCPVGKGDR